MQITTGETYTDQRSKELMRISESYGDSESLYRFLMHIENCPKSSVGLIALPFTRTDDRFGQVSEQDREKLLFLINRVSQNPETYYIATPEYSLYARPDVATPIAFNDAGDIIDGDASIIDTISQIKKISHDKNISIQLSSICERRILSNGKEVVFNSVILIKPDGTVTFRRKIGDIYMKNNLNGKWEDITTSFTDKVINQPENHISETQEINNEFDELKELTLGSLSSQAIIDQQGQTQQVTTIICSERKKPTVFEHIDELTSIITITVSEGSPINNRDIQVVTLIGELQILLSMLGDKLKNKSLKVVYSNERSGIAAVFELDENKKITAFSLQPLFF